MRAERGEKLGFDELWTHDGLRAIDPPGGFLTLEVDMTQADAVRADLKARGIHVTYTHLLARAVASALERLPDLHRLVAGRTRLYPGTVDLCLSIAGDQSVTPVVILKDAGSKNLETIAREVREGVSRARADDEKLAGALRKWGWIVPFSLLRRSLMRFLLNRIRYRRMVSGTFQITTVASVDQFVPFLFNTAGALSAGRVQERVVASGGKIEIRPILCLACCFDHKVWNGMDAAKFLNAVKDELETPGVKAETLTPFMRTTE